MGGLWGFQFALLKTTAMAGYSHISVLFISLVWLAVIFNSIVLFKKRFFQPTLALAVFFIISSFLGYTAPLLAALYAASHLSTGMIALIVSFTPVVTVLLVLFLRTERISVNKVTAITIAMLSAVLVLWPDVSIAENSILKWLLIAMIAPLCYGIDSIYIHAYWPEDLDALQVVCGETLVAALMLAPIYLFVAQPIRYSSHWPMEQWAIVLFIITSVFEVLLFFYLIEKTGAVLVAFASVITLFAGVVWGIVLFGEQHPLSVWIAMALLACSLIIVAMEKTSFEQNKVSR